MANIVCPKCTKRLKVDHLPAAGRRGACPACGHALLMVPASLPVVAAEPTDETSRLLAGVAIGVVAVLLLLGLAAVPTVVWLQSANPSLPAPIPTRKAEM